MKILQIAPPWITVPPSAYGGTEAVIDGLCRALRDQGHEVALFAPSGSTCPVVRLDGSRAPLGTGAPTAASELAHVLAAHRAAERWRPDVVHDHTVTGALLGPHLTEVPVVTTVHDPLRGAHAEIYREAARRCSVVAISRSQAASAPEVPIRAVIHHGIDIARLPSPRRHPRSDHLLCLGRMAPEKGADVAIEVARRAGLDLVIAGKASDPAERSWFAREIEPRLDDRIRYVGEVDQRTKYELLASARCLLNPIRWPEPFGMVMIEAMAMGTPVVTTAQGAAPEIVHDGLTGFISDDLDRMVDAVRRAPDLSGASCRASVLELFSARRMATDHATLYQDLVAARPTTRSDRVA